MGRRPVTGDLLVDDGCQTPLGGRRPLFVGESPAKRGASAEQALLGRCGLRLSRLMDRPLDRYARAVDRINLLPWWLGKAEDKPAWPVKIAREAALALEDAREISDRKLIVLFGRRVAHAFRMNHLEFFCSSTEMRNGGWCRFVVVPHPSGASRWWNSLENRQRAERWWHSFGRVYVVTRAP